MIAETTETTFAILATETIPESSARKTDISHNMASALTVDTASFMEEIQQYECLYNKFSKNLKNRDMKENCWGKIAEKFAISKLEAQNKFKNTRTAYGRFLRKKKKIPSGSGRDAVPTVPREFTNLGSKVHNS